jgi:uncharacterized membrane protein YhaH (DUF805 family)
MNPTMTPIDWAKRPLQKYADFSGRAPRAEYWWYVLAIIIAFVVVKIIESIVGINGMVLGVYGPLTILLWLATIVPSIAVSIRRLHDTNRSGWWILLPVVPYCIAFALGGRSMMSGSMTSLGTAGIFMLIGAVGWIVLFIFYVLPGTPGGNRYGPNPYGGAGTVAAE